MTIGNPAEYLQFIDHASKAAIYYAVKYKIDLLEIDLLSKLDEDDKSELPAQEIKDMWDLKNFIAAYDNLGLRERENDNE